MLIAPAQLGSSTWLLRLRTFAVVGQLVTIVVARALTPTDLPMPPLLALAAVTAITNLGYGWWLSRSGLRDRDDVIRPQRVAFVMMAIDLVTLTVMLSLTGGADNPFSFFYFVNLAVGGVMLEVAAVWTLSVMAIVCYAVILIQSRPVAGLTVATIESPNWALGAFDLRGIGLWFAFSACVGVVTHFVTRTTRQLRDRERDLRKTQAERADAMRLEGLTTLAAGAAHELATPLSAIYVACRELSRHLDAVPKPDSIHQDLALIDGQLMMCRQILARMRSAAGDAAADQWNRTTLGELIDRTLEGIRDPHRVEIVDDESWESQSLYLPEEAVAQSIRNLIHNGLDASEQGESVTIRPIVESTSVALHIIDSGTGMTDDVMDRAWDPFFTTKDPGRGIGLGLFLTRNVITRLGGTLDFESSIGAGTTVIVTLPVEPNPSLAAQR
ncbi:MAG: ATP-binding protein [Planctomycetota bacterium]